MFSPKLIILLAALPATLACLGYEGGVPKPVDTLHSSQVIEVKAGEVYDGGHGRGSTEVLVLAVTRMKEAEGVRCDGHCTLEFVWFEDVYEDAIGVINDKPGKETWIIGGGA
ncbi:hypothetical protein DL768_002599 [Monosporascus sp. mg162]|nr:hypothetical protein DL768_002599 [Monosporascus sp. mg162]